MTPSAHESRGTDRPLLSVLVLACVAGAAVWAGALRRPGWPTILLASAGVVLLLSLFALARSLRDARRVSRGRRALRMSEIDLMEGAEFELYVQELLERRGFGIEATGCSGDHGVDLIATDDETRYAVQVKRHNGPVSRRAVSDAVGGLRYYGCDAAIVVTNSYFTRGAETLAESNECLLVDRDLLAEWIAEWQGR